MHLLTNAIRRKLPPLYANEEQGTKALAIVKFFTPDSSWTWVSRTIRAIFPMEDVWRLFAAVTMFAYR